MIHDQPRGAMYRSDACMAPAKRTNDAPKNAQRRRESLPAMIITILSNLKNPPFELLIRSDSDNEPKTPSPEA